MNHAVNVFTFPILLIYSLMITIVSYDLSISTFSLRGMPYKQQIFIGFSVVILLFGAIRILRRWQGIRDIKKFSQFTFKAPISEPSIQYARLFTIVEAFFILAFLVYSITLLGLSTDYVLPMVCVLSALLVEMCIFILNIKQDGGSFQIGLNDKVVAYFNREMHLYFYTGLKKVELHSKDLINFRYKEDLNLTLPTNVIKPKDRVAFRNALIKVLEGKNVYIEDAFRNWE